MTRTVLITGCSSGFGLETARYFLDRDWQVVATMRTPRTELLPASPRLRVLALDVTDPRSIAHAVEAAGPIDVLVNNAGFGAASPAELTPLATVRQLFETNTFGTLALMQTVLPQFRQRRAGVVVNVTSSVTLKALPLIAAYRASKMAVDAFTESMAIELEPLGVRLRLVLPGRSPETRFGDNALGDGQFFWDFRNTDAQDYWAKEVCLAGTADENVDGMFTDDPPGYGAEHPAVQSAVPARHTSFAQ